MPASRDGIHARLLGMESVNAALNEVSKEMRGPVVRIGLRNQLQPVAATARRLAPVETGTLRSAIAVRSRKVGPTSFAAWTGLRGDRALSGRLVAIYGAAQEFGFFAGTQGASVRFVVSGFTHRRRREFSHGRFVPPQPFIRPAWQQHVGRIPNEFAADIRPVIQKAAARKAKKKPTKESK